MPMFATGSIMSMDFELAAAGNDVDALIARIERELAERLAMALAIGPDDVELDLPFRDLGLDSSRLVAIVDALNHDHALGLTPVALFEFPTARTLAEHFAHKHAQAWLGDDFEGMSDARQAPAPSARPAALATPAIDEPIAIIGMAGRFPGAADVDELWDCLRDGNDAISTVPGERWDWRAIDGDATRDGNRTSVRWGGFIDGVDEFDPLFFNISPREAHAMDPQQRLLMGCAWKAIEDSGHAPSSLSGSATGIFLGTGVSDYRLLMARSGQQIHAYTSIGQMPSAGPNRISHYLNLSGPSEPVETACSSSLVAIHRAVCAIRGGDCDLAIAGGVNVLLAPDNHISLSKAGALSPDGRCRTFSDRANGYVRSEGVAAIVLKPLSAAERDGDQIYGLIRASAVNHGGHSNSLTAPNPKAQADLIVKALARADVDPSSVGYVETHGTGTPLGDPIEVAGLRSAFAQLHARRGSSPGVGACGLGSIKSNIGHLELAAGVAGVIKVLLQLKHRVLVRSLHCETINPYLQLEGSPFYVVDENRPWPAFVDSSGDELPRRAGVSSFSVTGTNAHVLIEEYRPPRRERPIDSAPQAIVLSARDPTRLRAYATQLLGTLERARWSDSDLPDIAYTLQVGRDSMSERLGMFASSIEHLKRLLNDFLSGTSNDAVKRSRTSTSRATAGVTRSPESSGDCLLGRWMAGGLVDWAAYHQAREPRRCHLPTYPFAQERYGLVGDAVAPDRLTPLTPRFDTLPGRAQLDLHEDESFLADHRVHGERVLPAVAYLELALSTQRGYAAESSQAVALEDVVWLQRCVVGTSPLPLEITWKDGGDGRTGFEIASLPDTAHNGRIVHAQGSIVRFTGRHDRVDLSELRTRCDGAVVSAGRCYEAFAGIGLDYGPSHRAIEQVFLGKGELLARLRLPDSVQMGQFVLHPSLADAATQALIGFALDADDGRELAMTLPFELERAEIFSPCAPTLWAHARLRASGATGLPQVFDIDLYDDRGHLCVRLRGFSTRPASAVSSNDHRTLGSGYHLLDLEWTPVPQTAIDVSPATPAGATVVIVSDPATLPDIAGQDLRIIELDPDMDADAIQRRLVAAGGIDHLVWQLPTAPAPGDHDAVLAAFEDGVMRGFRLIRALLALGYDERPLTLTAITRQCVATHRDEAINPTHAGVHGLIGSLASEYPHWRARVLDLSDGHSPPWHDLLAAPHAVHDPVLACREDKWLRQSLRPHRPAAEPAPMTRPGGVYLVIGGAGGIGRAWSEATLRRHDAQLIWVGRRALDATIQAKLDQLAQLGPRPRYLSADATSLEEMLSVRDTVLGEFGRIDGVIHSALELHDRSLANLGEQEFRATYAVKADSCIRLAQVFASRPPGFVLFFSAFNALAKAAGQSNYVAGCAFSDAFARHLASAWPCPVRTMNWGWWGEVGVAANDFHRDRMIRSGAESIQIDAAMQALDRLHASGRQQLAFVRLGRASRIAGTTVHPVQPLPAASSNEPSDGAAMSDALLALAGGQPRAAATLTLLEALRVCSCQVLGLDPARLESGDRPFSETMLGEFGMDSLSATALRNKLRHEIGMDVRAQLIIGETAGRIAELMYEQLLLRQVSVTSSDADDEETETFVL